MNWRDKQILTIALPSIVSNITVPLLGLVDVAITGHLGSAAYIGAIAVGGMLFNIIYWMFAFLRMGTSGMTAQAFGARNFPEVVSVLLRAVLVSVMISGVMLCLQVPVRDLSLSIIMPSDAALHGRDVFSRDRSADARGFELVQLVIAEAFDFFYSVSKYYCYFTHINCPAFPSFYFSSIILVLGSICAASSF